MSYNINTLISDAATAAGCNDFLLGHRAFHNQERPYQTPVCWIQLLEIKTKVLANVSFETTYIIRGFIGDQCNLDASSTKIQTVLGTLYPIYEQFISYLAERALEPLREVNARQMIHLYDDNHVGYEFDIVIKIEEEHSYLCP
jgi:hypothetical protein